MPFTFSHPAIVLPLLKLSPKYISASAVIIGSMAPDFEYFIRMRLQQVHGHNLAGAFYFDLPVALISTFLFQFLVRDTLIEHLPIFLRKKYELYYKQDWLKFAQIKWYVIIYSALIGIFSHLFWDAFTHAPGYFVQYIPFLKQTIRVFYVDVPTYDLMQLISTFIGGVVILIYVLWPTNHFLKGQDWKKSFKYITVIFIVMVSVVFLRNANTQSEYIATIISGGLIGMIVTPFILKRIKVKHVEKTL